MSRKITEFVAVPLIVLNLAFVVACDSGNDDPVTPSDTELNNVPNMEPDYIPNTEPDNVSDQSADSITVLPANQFNPNINYSSITDFRDGKIYKTVLIGTQTWMAENLNFETENSYCYNDVPSNCETYGRLYTWAAAMDSAGVYSMAGALCGDNVSCNPITSVRGVCPEGWHLPSLAEWNALITAVKESSSFAAGTSLKSSSGWYNGFGANDFGFSALPAGSRGEESYGGQGLFAYFWSTTEYNSFYVYSLELGHNYNVAELIFNSKWLGFSVRCLKD